MLGSNLVAPVGQPCLTFASSAASVTLDCQGHSITAQQGAGDTGATELSLNGVTGFLVVNCGIHAPPDPPPGATLLNVNASSSGVFETTRSPRHRPRPTSLPRQRSAWPSTPTFFNAPITSTASSGDYFGASTVTAPAQNEIYVFDFTGTEHDRGGREQRL